MRNPLGKLKIHLCVITLYTILTLIFTYPLVTHFTSHVPGTDIWAFDEYAFVWNLWWVKHALLDLKANPLYTDYIFYPLGVSLALYTLAIFNALISLPLQPFLSLAAVSNIIIVFSFVLSGYGTFLLVEYLLRGERRRSSLFPAFIAGLVYAFASCRFVYASQGHYNIVSSEWIPFYSLFLIKTVREPEVKNAVLAGIFATLALLCEMTFGVLLAFLTVIYLLFAGREKILNIGFFKRFALLIAVSLGLYWPILIPVLRQTLSGEYELPGWGGTVQLSADLLGFFTPTTLHPFWGRRWTEELLQVVAGKGRFADVNTVFLGYLVPLLALLAVVKYRKSLKVWGAMAMAFVVLSLGPVLHINGRYVFDLEGLQVTIPLPFILLHYIPLVKANRVPNRFSVVLMLSLAVLVGYACAWLLGRQARQRRWVVRMAGSLLAVVILLEHLPIPLPLTDARVPDIYYQIAQEPGDFAILQFPLGWRQSFDIRGAERTQLQYYQAIHHKRMPNGNTSRVQAFKFEYFTRIPFFKSIMDLEYYKEVSEERKAYDEETAPQLMYFFDIRYVIFHPAVPGRLPYADTKPRVEDYVRQVVPMEQIYDKEGVVAYRVIQPAPKTDISIDFGTQMSELYRGQGWSRNEGKEPSLNWAVEQGARLFIPLREDDELSQSPHGAFSRPLEEGLSLEESRRENASQQNCKGRLCDSSSMGDYQMTIAASPFSYEGSPTQTMEVRVNGRFLTKLELAVGWAPYEVTIPASFLRPGLNEVAFYFAHLASPHDVLPANFAIGQTGVSSAVDITINSAGMAAGDFAYIEVAGKDASVHRRGYNVAVIDPTNGKVVEVRGFDTWANQYESQGMAEFINAIPVGHIVAVAVKGDGAKSLTAEAVEALKTIGAQIDLRGTEGRSHAIIGVKGAKPGQALELSGEGNSYLHVGSNPDERTLAVAVDFVTFEKK